MDFDARQRELRKQSMESGDFRLALLLANPVEFYLPEIDFPQEFYVALPSQFSEHGQQTLRAAYESHDANTIDDLNHGASLMESHCDANHNDAMTVALAMSEVAEAGYRCQLERYEDLFASLSPPDQEVIRQMNLEHIGADYPSLPQDYRRTQVALAAEFPQQYLERYRTSCKKVLANRGRPYRKVVAVPKAKPNGEESYLTFISYTQDEP